MIKLAIRACFVLLLFVSPTQAGGGNNDRLCLAEALYFEARSEGWRGMLAVGIVIQNRVRDNRYPDTVCGVVRQGRYRNGTPVRHKCQFSYWCDGKPERVEDHASWFTATDLAKMLLSTRVELASIVGSTHYHAVYVRPPWSRKFKKKDRIGKHIFYVSD